MDFDDFEVIAGDETLNLWCLMCGEYAKHYGKYQFKISLEELANDARNHECVITADK